VSRAPAVRLRPATREDVARLWQWRNDPQTRRASLDESEISLEAHARWLEQTLARPDRRLYVATSTGKDVASARLDIAAGEAEVSVTVAPEHRGRGLGPAVLQALARDAFGALGLARLVARIKRDNTASLTAFERAGFCLVEEGPVLMLIRESRRRRPPPAQFPRGRGRQEASGRR